MCHTHTNQTRCFDYTGLSYCIVYKIGDMFQGIKMHCTVSLIVRVSSGGFV